jgi:eukaryotic-like serine/threonine-protein kinase
MNPGFQRVKSLFLTAAEKETPGERIAFLDEACGGDDSLRAQVEVLLNAHDDADSFLKPLAISSATIDDGSHVSERPGTVIGPYKLLQEIGEGGMGTVFLVELSEPVRRKVALKIIKPGMDSAQVIARFEAERQALAMMDHPNIAKVLDAGTTASGRPFFVMELVKGASIITYCDENRLTPRQRLELFIPICHAIQHAHQKGIIHRDIKPSNVLVALYDGKPVPKVIDFGIAKATDQPLTEKTLFTRHGQIVGTFEYMSPEQATLDSLDVDTRSDIYSLGVLLYELLTGTTPLDKDRLRQAALLEVLRLIREEEAPRPSLRLSESRGALVAASVQRHTDADKLLGLVTGELDWIVMKSLDKDRTRRYATAAGLALDVEHYLKDEQVEACPPSAGYRLRKFVRRNKGPVLTAAAVLLAVIGGIVGTSWGWVEALSQRDAAVQARKDEAEQRRVALTNAANAKTNEQKARAEEQKAKEASDEAVRLAKKAVAASTQADEEREKALVEKQQADLARQEETKARKLAVEERQKAVYNENKAEWRLYASHIASAQREWETDNVSMLDHYLKLSRPEFRGWEHDYLYTLANQYQQILPATKQHILTFSPDDKRLAITSHRFPIFGKAKQAAEVQVWDLASGKVLTLKDTWGSLAFSPDGTRLASGWDHTELGNGDKRFEFRSHGIVKVSDAVTGKEIFALDGHAGIITGLVFSPDGKRLASSSRTE